MQQHTFPELFSFAKNKTLSFQKATSTVPFHSHFHLSLSEEALDQMELLQNLINSQQTSSEADWWSYIWGTSFFSSQKAYKNLVGHAQVHPCFKWLWKSCCQNKHKVFFWLLLKDRLSTRNILRRRSMTLDSYACVLCNANVEETMEHLFLSCPFVIACWNLLGDNQG